MNAFYPIFLAASAFYRFGYKLHHMLFLRPQPKLHSQIIIVGSYLAGGAGKTPFTIWLAKHIAEQEKKIAILCHRAAWDELILWQQELQSYLKQHSQNASRALAKIKIIATKNRYATAKKIQHQFDIIICDDGFEDTRFTGATRICLDWQKPPQSWTSLLPSGPFRSLRQDHDEHNVIHFNCAPQSNGSNQNKAAPDIFFSIKSITNFFCKKKFFDKSSEPLTATVICGIGSPKRFIEDLLSFGIHIEKVVIRPDHDKHFLQAVKKELSYGRHIVLTQKDSCRLPQELRDHNLLHIAIQETIVSDKVLNAIDHITSPQNS